MSEAAAIAAVSDVVSLGPLTPETSPAQIDARKADPAYRERILRADPDATAEWGALHAALFPTAQNASELAAQIPDSEAALMEKRIEGYLRLADLTPAQQEEVRKNQPIAANEQKFAREEINRLKRDTDFTRRLMQGGRDARTTWTRLHLLISLPTSKKTTTY